MERYSHCKDKWNSIFSGEKSSGKLPVSSGHPVFDRGLKWVCETSESIVDFGCGNGSMLLICHHFGTQTHLGIDFSKSAVERATEHAAFCESGRFKFVEGGIEALADLESHTIDAFVLSNIIDNLYPDDAAALLSEVHRVLKKEGKLLVKLNPHLTMQQIHDWNIEVIEGNLLNDGLILWNNTTEEWVDFFSNQFEVLEKTDIYYEAYEQFNRMMWLKPKLL